MLYFLAGEERTILRDILGGKGEKAFSRRGGDLPCLFEMDGGLFVEDGGRRKGKTPRALFQGGPVPISSGGRRKGGLTHAGGKGSISRIQP